MELVVSQQHANTKRRSMMFRGFFLNKKLPSSSKSEVSIKPHLALSVPCNKFPVQGIAHRFASKARLFRKLTWGKLPKKPVFRHPNLFSKDQPGMKLLQSKVKKKESPDIVVPNRGIQKITRILQGKQGQGVSARKSLCQPENGMDDRKDGELELCKKRILIGYKCRPLGTLRYDQNGILLPELLFP